MGQTCTWKDARPDTAEYDNCGRGFETTEDFETHFEGKTVEQHVHVISTTSALSVAVEHDCWLGSGEPCILCDIRNPQPTRCGVCDGGLFITEWPDESDDGTVTWSHQDEGCDDPTPTDFDWAADDLVAIAADLEASLAPGPAPEDDGTKFDDDGNVIDADAQTLREARELGKNRADAEASWYFDGNSDVADVRRVLTGIEDGDPEILDAIGRAPLSGEFAEDGGIRDLSENTGIDAGAEFFNDVATAYEEGYWERIQEAVAEEGRKLIPDSDHDEVLEAVEAARDALVTLREAIGSDRDVSNALRNGGSSDDLARAPYALRNLLPDLEGSEGGWLMAEGESFLENLNALAAWVAGEDEDGEDR